LYGYSQDLLGGKELSVFNLSDTINTHEANTTSKHEVVFIDDQVTDYLDLISDVSSNVHVVVLDSSKDSIDQISSYMETQNNVDAIHIISHGNTGELILGDKVYTENDLGQYQSDFAKIGQAL